MAQELEEVRASRPPPNSPRLRRSSTGGRARKRARRDRSDDEEGEEVDQDALVKAILDGPRTGFEIRVPLLRETRRRVADGLHERADAALRAGYLAHERTINLLLASNRAALVSMGATERELGPLAAYATRIVNADVELEDEDAIGSPEPVPSQAGSPVAGPSRLN